MGIVHLIRHGAPRHQGVLLGALDSPLADVQLAPPQLPVHSIFSSPLLRARQTAQLLFPGRSITILDDLREVSLGEWDGRQWADIEALWPDLARRKCQSWTSVTPPGGEPWNLFVARVERTWKLIREAMPPAAVVAHSGVNAVLAQFITGADPLQFSQNYGEVITLEAV